MRAACKELRSDPVLWPVADRVRCRPYFPEPAIVNGDGSGAKLFRLGTAYCLDIAALRMGEYESPSRQMLAGLNLISGLPVSERVVDDGSLDSFNPEHMQPEFSRIRRTRI